MRHLLETTGRTGRLRVAGLTLLVGLAVTLTPRPAEARQPLPLQVQGVSFDNGKLLALITLGGTRNKAKIRVPIRLSSLGGGTCPILHLELQAIHLNLLGLVVQTSDICLNIDAPSGGGLLGDLLCSVSHLLDQGLSLRDILKILGPKNTGALLSAIRDLLQEALDQITSLGTLTNTALVGCPVLHLSLGPITLNLLGLVVALDNCHGGPVTVDISAIPGGGLLGDLLCSLTGFDAETILQQIIDAILGL